MAVHRHPPVLRIAAQHLVRVGRIETFDAVYRWQCPDCGLPRRTTRLADTMYALRHAYGWDIVTIQPHGEVLAAYVLVKAGDMPGETNTPHPRQLVGTIRGTGAADSGSGPTPTAPSPRMDSQPEPQLWECSQCQTRSQLSPTAKMLLGGMASQPCPRCLDERGLPKVRIFLPVRRGA